MTVGAGETLSGAVIGMAEGVAIRARSYSRGPVWFSIVTDTARCDLTSGGRFARRRVARVATIVCNEVRGNEKTSAAIEGGVMTTRAASLRSSGPGVVLRVIEFDVEGFVEPHWKRFEGRVVAADICVTDRAHRHLGRRELAAVTVGARFMTRKAWRGRVVGALVT